MTKPTHEDRLPDPQMISLRRNGSTTTTTLSRPIHLGKGSSDKLIRSILGEVDLAAALSAGHTTPLDVIVDRALDVGRR